MVPESGFQEAMVHLLVPPCFLVPEFMAVASPSVHGRDLLGRRDAAWEALKFGGARKGESPRADIRALDHGTIENLVASAVGEELEAAANIAQGRQETLCFGVGGRFELELAQL